MAKNKLKEEVREYAQLQRLRRGFINADDDKKLWKKLRKRLTPMELEQFEAEIKRLLKPHKEVTHG